MGSKSNGKRRPPRLNLLVLTALAGLLIWAKLRLVTNFPRTVLANPDKRQVERPSDPQASPEQGRNRQD